MLIRFYFTWKPHKLDELFFFASIKVVFVNSKTFYILLISNYKSHWNPCIQYI